MNVFKLSIPSFLKESLKGNPYLGRTSGYKFHNLKARSAICERGSIKIGTLDEYRRHEKETTRDKNEGFVTFQTLKDHTISIKDFHKDNPVHSSFKLLDGANLLLTNSRISFMTPEIYVYCYSFSCAESVRQSFDDADSYDSVAEIVDIDALATSVCKYHPQLKNSKYLNLPIIYRDAHRSPFEAPPRPLQVVFEKLSIYADNLEGRIVFMLPEGSPFVGPLPPWEHPSLRGVFRQHPMPCTPSP